MAEGKKKNNLTNTLLKCGVFAGPLYIVVGLLEVLTRPGFDIRKHALSLMSLGEFGWIHITLFIVVGLLTILGALGIRRSIRGERAGTWGPLMIGLYGIGLIAAGIFAPDPMKGFPLGMPAAITTHGLMHLVSGSIGFVGLIAACFVFARRFKGLKMFDMLTYSMTVGIVFFVSFFGIAGFSQLNDTVAMIVNLAFTFAVVLSWIWYSTITSQLIKK